MTSREKISNRIVGIVRSKGYVISDAVVDIIADWILSKRPGFPFDLTKEWDRVVFKTALFAWQKNMEGGQP